MIYPASKREQRIFSYWLDYRLLKVQGITAIEFMRRCNAGQVPGFEPSVESEPQRGDATAPGPVGQLGR